MVKFIVAAERANLSNKWVESPDFNDKDKMVDEQGESVSQTYAGHKYRFVSKMERSYACFERFGRGFLGVLTVICSLGIALFSSFIKNLIIMHKEILFIGTPVTLKVSIEPEKPSTEIPQTAVTLPEEIPAARVHVPVTTQVTVHQPKPQMSQKQAAITVQKYFRGYLARKHFLPSTLYPSCLELSKKVERHDTDSIPLAAKGCTRVFLPLEIPKVVMKHSGRKKAIKRFRQMQGVSAILKQQKSRHLIVPKALLCQNSIFEQRLPINPDAYHNMELYISKTKLFDDPVRELTRLFSRAHLHDLVEDGRRLPIPLAHIAGVEDTVRYDNLPLFIVEKDGNAEGRIGLIDLEGVVNEPKAYGLSTLIRIFPFHFDLIKEEAGKLNMKFENDACDVEAAKGKKYLQVAFTGHVEWLRQKGVSLVNPLQPFEISPERINELQQIVEKELLKLNQGTNDAFVRAKWPERETPLRDFLIGNLEEAAKELSVSLTSSIVNNIKSQIAEQQKEKLEKSSKSMSNSEMVGLRSPVLNRRKIFTNIKETVEKSTGMSLKDKFYGAEIDLGEQLLYVVVQALVGREVFYFDPEYYNNTYCWIRY